MHLGPIVIFALILFVLTLSILFGHSLVNPYSSGNTPGKEGLQRFRYDENDEETYSRTSTTGNITIPKYHPTKNVHKLYDNIYYDYTNGAVIVVNGEQYDTDGTADIVGNTITSITQYDRMGNQYGTVDSTGNTSLSLNSTLDSSYKSFTITTIINESSDKYELVYVPWDKYTILHLIILQQNNATSNTHKYTFFYDNQGRLVSAQNDGGVSDMAKYANMSINIGTGATANRNDNTFQPAPPKYSRVNKLYQLCAGVQYDPANGNLVYASSLSGTETIVVYSRPTNTTRILASTSYTTSDSTIPNPETEVSSVPTGKYSVAVQDFAVPNYTVIYLAYGKKTVLIALSKNATSLAYDVYKVVRFKENGNISADNSTEIAYGGGSYDTNPYLWGKDDVQKWLNNYYGFLMYSQGSSINGGGDYMLKTQIVPPVCPTCPRCPSFSGVCGNCGGNGGSGTSTLNTAGKNGGSGTSTLNTAGKNGDGITDLLRDTGSGAVNLARDTGSGAVSLARDTGSGAVNLARDTGSGAVSLARDTVGGTVGLAKDVAGGTVGLAKDVAGGTVGLAKDVGSAVGNTLGRLNPTTVSDNSQPNYGTNVDGTKSSGVSGSANVPNTAGSDSLSYFGALPSKGGGNFMPITSDFSRFGR